MMTKETVTKLCLTRSHPRIPEGLQIPGKVKTRVALSEWLIGLGFDRREQDFWDVYRLLRDEFPVAIYATDGTEIDQDLKREKAKVYREKKRCNSY